MGTVSKGASTGKIMLLMHMNDTILCMEIRNDYVVRVLGSKLPIRWVLKDLMKTFNDSDSLIWGGILIQIFGPL